MAQPGLTAEEVGLRIRALEEALAAGESEYEYSDDGGQRVRVQYRSLSELRRALEYFRARYEDLTGAPAGGGAVFTTGSWGRE